MAARLPVVVRVLPETKVVSPLRVMAPVPVERVPLPKKLKEGLVVVLPKDKFSVVLVVLRLR